MLSPVLFNRITFLGDFFEYFFTTCGILKPTSGVREVHKVRMVVTKEWRKVKSADAGIRICLSCRDNSSFSLNSLGPLCLLQCLGYCTVAKWVPMGTFFSFWVSIGSLFLFQGPHFLYLRLNKERMKSQCSHYLMLTIFSPF